MLQPKENRLQHNRVISAYKRGKYGVLGRKRWKRKENLNFNASEMDLKEAWEPTPLNKKARNMPHLQTRCCGIWLRQ
jgi:hypothetical protein